MELTLDRIKALAKRLADAEEVKDRRISRSGPNAYMIPRSAEAGTLGKRLEDAGVPDSVRFAIVVRVTGGWTCNCEDWQYNQLDHGGYCKHVIAIMEIEQDPKMMENLEVRN